MRPILAVWMAVAGLVVFSARGAALAEEAAPRDRLDEHLTRARAKLVGGDMRAARKELGKAARQLEKKVQPASGVVEEALVKQANALKSLSAEVDKGHVSDPHDLDAAAGRAHAVVAKFHQLRAGERWSDEQPGDTGRELRAAAHHLERGAAWLGRSADTVVLTASHEASALSGQLIDGGGYAPEQVEQGIQAVGREIDRLGWRYDARQGRPGAARPR